MKKSISLLLAICLFLSSIVFLAGCARQQVTPDDKVDSSKSQLYISNYEGGFGREWLDEAAERFEEKYADVSFEPGKKGVQIRISSSVNGKTGDTFIKSLKSDPNEVIFTEDAFYYTITSGGYAADITDVVTGSLSDYGEDGTIEDKLDPTLKNFFNLATEEGGKKYYALPHYEAYYGIVYDVDLFDERGFWLTTDPSYPYAKKEDFELDSTLIKSNGPDGKPGTYDDGLPATYDEFFALCDYMKAKGVTPFVWPGGVPAQATLSLCQLWADYEGKAGYELNFTLNGTATSLIDYLDNGETLNASGEYNHMLSDTVITTENGYLLQKQAGRYAALEFAKKLIDGEYASVKSFGNDGNALTQDTYLRSNVATDTPIAFLLDGVWWENEADEEGIFKNLEKFGVSRDSRKFGWMPMPKASAEQVGDKRTIAADATSVCFINSNVKDENKLKLAKEFLKFVHTDEELQNFSMVTSALKAFKYPMPEEKMEKMTYFGKQIASLRNNENVEIAYPVSNNSVYVNHYSMFDGRKVWDNTVYNSSDPLVIFKKSPATTIKDLFDNITNNKGSSWWTSSMLR